MHLVVDGPDVTMIQIALSAERIEGSPLVFHPEVIVDAVSNVLEEASSDARVGSPYISERTSSGMG